MKKFIITIIALLLAMLIFILCIAYRKPATSKSTIQPPLIEISTVYDQYNNILQQTVYNEDTDEYFIKDFIYEYKNNKWICIKQTTKQIVKNIDTASYNLDPTLNIYYLTELSNNQSLVLLDNNEIKISLIEVLKPEGWWEYGYKMKIENKSSKALTIAFSQEAIANVSCQPMFSACSVASYDIEYFNLAWAKDSLERSWVPYLDNVTFTLEVYKSKSAGCPALYGTNILLKS